MTKYSQMLKAHNNKETFCSYSPLHIYIEPTNFCNLNCPHCSWRLMKREKGFMELEFYTKLIDQCKDFGINWVYLFHLGESTLHKDLKDMIDYARKNGIKNRLHTNGTIDVSGFEIDDLHISLNITEFLRIKKNLDILISKNIEFKIDVITEIAQKLPRRYNKYIVKKKFYNWQGRVGKMKRTSDTICSHPYKSMVILWDGRCVPCCVDYDGRYIIGDAKIESLEKIWNGPKMQEIRKESAPMCKFCNLEKIPEPERPGYKDR